MKFAGTLLDGGRPAMTMTCWPARTGGRTAAGQQASEQQTGDDTNAATADQAMIVSHVAVSLTVVPIGAAL